jgi:flagellar protein FliO/FliZ
VLQVALYLGLIVGLIVVLGFVARKLGQNNFQTGGGMKVVSSLPLGMKEKLVLVQIGEQQILVGVTPSSISRIETFDGVVIEKEAEGLGDFRVKLQEIMQQNQAR